MFRFLVPLVLYQVATQTSALGSLVFTSTAHAGLSAPALMALIQGLANAGALLIAQLTPVRLQRYLPRLTFWCATTASLLNAGAALALSDISAPMLFIRLLFGALLTSLLLSQGPRLLCTDVKKGNQRFQLWTSIASLLGFGLAPILAASVELLFLTDFALSATAFAILSITSLNSAFTRLQTSSEPTEAGTNPTTTTAYTQQLSYIGAVTVALWCFGGFFHVIEVPLLVHRFSLVRPEISAVFVLTLLLNIGAVAALDRDWVARWSWHFLIGSTIFVGSACLLYLQTQSLPLVVISVALIGAANGAFNLAQSTILQRDPEPHRRLRSFLLVRLIAQVGLMFGALAAGSGIIIEDFTGKLAKDSSSTTLRQVKVARILVQNLPQDLDPSKNTDTGAMLVIHQVFEKLFEYDSKNNLVPRLIETLAWRNNNQTLILTLRPGVRFSNGDELLANDVVTALLNAKATLGEAGRWAFGNLKSISAIDTRHLRIDLGRPFALLPAILASPYFGIGKRLPDGTPIGTGEYMVDSRAPSRIILKRNPVNRTLDPEAPESIEFSDAFDPSLRYTLSDQDPASKSGTRQTLAPIEYRTLQTVLFIPNFLDPVMRKKEFRCGLIKELSRISPLAYSRWKSADLGLPFSSDLFPVPSRNISDGHMSLPRPIVIHYSNSAARFEEVSNSKISSHLRERGYQVSFEQIPIKELVDRARKGSFTGLMFGYVPDFVHPHALVSPMMGTGQTFNFGRYSNPTIDRLLESAISEANRIKQNEIYARILKLLQNECAVAFLGSQTGTAYLDPNLEAPEIGQLGFHNLRLASLRYKQSQSGDER